MFKNKQIHFIGIGGIGLSALAKYFLIKGNKITGSDLQKSTITDEFKNLGIKIYLGKHKAKNLNKKTDLVIYSVAVPLNNPEIKKAKKLKIPIKSYPQVLGEITKNYFTLAIAGSHGKSTTTALIALTLTEAGFDPTVIIGTKLKEFKNNNFRYGLSSILVIEADEYNKSFLNYQPDIIILTNIDKEHLDTYKNLSEIKKTFLKFLKKLPKNGIIIANFQDKNIREILPQTKRQVIFYNKKNFKKLPLGIFGQFNQLNAQAAYQTLKLFKISDNLIKKVFKKYQGAWRRQELIKKWKGNLIFSDYGHHPREIKETLKGFKEKFPHKKIILIFQPHQLQRLNYLFNEFINCFDLVDILILMKEYKVAGREKIKKPKTSFDLYKEIKKRSSLIFYAPNFKKSIKILKKLNVKNSIIIFMGAGDLDEKLRKYYKVH